MNAPASAPSGSAGLDARFPITRGLDAAGRALYFSRSVIPHARQWDDALLTSTPPSYFQHVGLYAYRKDATFSHDLSAREPGRVEALRKRLLAYLQMVTTSVDADRVWPAGKPAR